MSRTPRPPCYPRLVNPISNERFCCATEVRPPHYGSQSPPIGVAFGYIWLRQRQNGRSLPVPTGRSAESTLPDKAGDRDTSRSAPEEIWNPQHGIIKIISDTLLLHNLPTPPTPPGAPRSQLSPVPHHPSQRMESMHQLQCTSFHHESRRGALKKKNTYTQLTP